MEHVDRLKLPSGGWAVLRDPATLRARHKKDVIRKMHTPDQEWLLRSGLELTDGIICCVVEEWHVPYLPEAPIPVEQPDVLEDLEIPDYDALTAAIQPYARYFQPARPDADDAVTRDPDTPFGPVSGLVIDSRA